MGKRWRDRSRDQDDDQPVLRIQKVMGAADMHQYDDDVHSSRLAYRDNSSMLQSSSVSTSKTPSEAVPRSSTSSGTERSASDSGSFFRMASSSGIANQNPLGFIESKPRSIVGTLNTREKPRKRQSSPDNSMLANSQIPSSSSRWSSHNSTVADDDDDDDLYKVDPEPSEETSPTRRDEVVPRVNDKGEPLVTDPRRRSSSTDSKSQQPHKRERDPISLQVPQAWKEPVKAEPNISAISSSRSSSSKPPSNHSTVQAENSQNKRSRPSTDTPSTSTNSSSATGRRNSGLEIKPDISPETDLRPIVNRRDRDVVSSAIPLKEHKVKGLEQQLSNLKSTEIELRRRQRAKGGNSGYDLENNLRHQQNILREIETTTTDIENMRKKVARYDEIKAQRVADQAALKAITAPKQPREPLGLVKGEDPLPFSPATPTPAPATPQIQYRFVDKGEHWCKHCKEVFSFLPDFVKHMHHKHSSMVDDLTPANRPWFVKPKEDKESKIVQSLPIKGVEFVWPSNAFYCELCKEFYGDGAAVQTHLESENHHLNYKKHTQSNPSYEKKIDSEKNNSLMKKKADTARQLEEVMRGAFSGQNANRNNKEASTSNKDNGKSVRVATVSNAESASNKETQSSINANAENVASTSNNTQPVGLNHPIKIKEEPKDSGYEKYMGNKQTKEVEKRPVEKAVVESVSHPVRTNEPAAEERTTGEIVSSNLVIASVTSIKKEHFAVKEETPEEIANQPSAEEMQNREENLGDHTSNGSNLLITSVTSIKKEQFALKEETLAEKNGEDANLELDSDQDTVVDPMDYARDDDFMQ